MRNCKLLLLVLLILVTGSASIAAVWTVSANPGSAQFTTLQQAHTAAANGDTVVVGPGSYALVVNSKRLHYVGAGWDVCIINSVPPNMGFSLSPGSTGTSIEGFRVIGSSWGVYIYSGVDSITVRRCLLNTGGSQVGFLNGRLLLEDCVLNPQATGDNIVLQSTSGNLICRNVVFGHGTAAGFANDFEGSHGGVIEIYNCVFLNSYQPFVLTGLPQVIGLNNIFWDWASSTTYGTLPAGSVFEYTAAGQGNPTFPANFTNNISLGTNNPFVTYNNANNYEIGVSNLRLNNSAGGNACRDTGYPSIQDLDGSDCDLGVFGGPKPLVDNGLPPYPFAITLDVDPLVEVGDSVGVSSTGRIGPRY